MHGAASRGGLITHLQEINAMSETQVGEGWQIAGVNTGEAVMASELADLAANVSGRPSPAVVWNNADRAALAAEALWLFADRTGLASDTELMETVIIDFLANLLHLCQLVGILTPEQDGFRELLETAEMHLEMEEGEIG
jgi:hypothetical protein